MKFILTLAICCIGTISFAQETGIKFQNNLTWAQVKEKAKQENKYIFVDCYTTWCVPCKVMAKEIFPQPKVASFFNEKFVSVAVQLDKTKHDDPNTKRWFKEVKRIEEEAKVNAYPTYLFYTPNGELVHTIIGGSPDADTFLVKAKEALNPETQLKYLRQQYAAGKRSPEFLHMFGKTLMQSWDSQAPAVINQYLATQNNLLTKENAQFIMLGTKTSADPGFKVLLNHGEEFDKLTNPGLSKMIFGRIVFDELVLPMERINGKKEEKGGMIFYTGEVNKNINWADVYVKLRSVYPAQADELLSKSKVQYYRDLNDWPNFTTQAASYTKQFGNNNNYQVVTYANDIMLFADDKASFAEASGWLKPIATATDVTNNWYIDVYARLLYKLGNKEEALAIVNNGVAKLGDKAYGLKETQEKMKKGEL